MQKIIPHLWFDKNAEEAVQFYTSVFKGGKMGSVTRYPEAGQEVHHMEPGTVLTVEFEIEGYSFIALNGGPVFTFTPTISFVMTCPTKEEVDDLWTKLSEGGTALMPLEAYPFSPHYGWIQDKYGVSWQIYTSDRITSRTLYPCLMFTGEKAGKAEEAINFYTSLFANSSVGDISRYPAGQEHDKEGTVMYGEFTLEGQKFAAMDSAGPHEFTFNEAVSLLVTCEDQAELDRLWTALSAVPESEQCGWLKDKYGVSWQIAPAGMAEVLNNPNKEKANRAMSAMLKMKKLDIAALRAAVEGN